MLRESGSCTRLGFGKWAHLSALKWEERMGKHTSLWCISWDILSCLLGIVPNLFKGMGYDDNITTRSCFQGHSNNFERTFWPHPPYSDIKLCLGVHMKYYLEELQTYHHFYLLIFFNKKFVKGLKFVNISAVWSWVTAQLKEILTYFWFPSY